MTTGIDITQQAHEGPPRADALDALRGVAILGMVFSGVVPFGVLPTWMYHAQVPPPDHVFDPNLPGLTWVDLVFPFFIFSMGASIPFALARRMVARPGWVQSAGYVVKRGLLLAFFAIFVQHIRPNILSIEPDAATWGYALLALALLFPAYVRLPRSWGKQRIGVVRLVGWGAALAFLMLAEYPDNKHPGFWVGRSDIIIVVLANVAVFCPLVWIATRHNVRLRMLVMVALIAIRLSHTEDGWVATIWNWSPIPWMYKLYYLQYLLIALPGTIVGDLLYERFAGDRGSPVDGGMVSTSRASVLAFVMIALVVLICAGLQARWLPWTTFIALAVCGLLTAAWRTGGDPSERLLQQLFHWGTCWLVVGLLFEPWEGGIKKDHPTLSYYFVTSGLACFSLVALTFACRSSLLTCPAKLLQANGRNPMVAYVGMGNFIVPVLGITGIGGVLQSMAPGPWPATVVAACKTVVLALLVALCTEKKLIWRT